MTNAPTILCKSSFGFIRFYITSSNRTACGLLCCFELSSYFYFLLGQNELVVVHLRRSLSPVTYGIIKCNSNIQSLMARVAHAMLNQILKLKALDYLPSIFVSLSEGLGPLPKMSSILSLSSSSPSPSPSSSTDNSIIV